MTWTLSDPIGVAFDAAGDLFISNYGNNVVSVVPVSSGTVFGQSVTADTGATLTAASGLSVPWGMAFDGTGDLFVVDYGSDVVTVVPSATGTVFGQSVTSHVASVLASVSDVSSPVGMTLDGAGDLFIANAVSNAVMVLPAATGTIFGQSVTAGTVTVLTAASGLSNPHGLAFDSAGDLLIANYSNNTVTVVPKATGTLFGQSVTANTAVALTAASGLSSPNGLAFDSAGDLFIANYGNNTVRVVPEGTGTLFGQSVTANTVAALTAASGLSDPAGLAFDTAGDLFIANYGNNTVRVVPEGTGTLFGQSVTANTVAALTAASGLSDPAGLAFDTAGDLFIANYGNSTVKVVPEGTGTLFGQSVTANTVATLTAASGLSGPYGLVFDGLGNLYITNYSSNSIDVAVESAPAVTTASLSGATVGMTYSATVAGSGGVGSDTWSLSSGTLPAGLSLSTSSGAITGTPTATGDSSFTVEMTDGVGETATKSLSVDVTGAATSVSVSSSANPSAHGASITLTATVTGSSPTGSVAFYDGATDIGSGTLNGSYAAALATSSLGVGSHSITASYAGDSGNASSTSSTLTQVVLTATSVSVTSSANPSGDGSSVTFTATVTGSSPTGSVTFYDGATDIGSGTLNGSYAAALATSSLGVGSHSITASYAGDAANAASTSSVLTEVVKAGNSTTTTTAPSTSATTEVPGATTGSQGLEAAQPPSDVRSSDLDTPSSVLVNSESDATVSVTTGSVRSEIVIPGGALPSATVLSIYPVKTTAALSPALPRTDAYIASVVVSWRAPYGREQASTPVTLKVTDSSIRHGDSIYEIDGGKLELVGKTTKSGAVTVTFTKDPVFVVAAPPHLAPRSALSSSTGSTVSYRFSCVSGTTCTGRATLSVERKMVHNGTTRYVQVILGRASFSVKRHATRTISFTLTAMGSTKLAHLSSDERFRLGLVVHVTGGARRVRLVYVGSKGR